MVHSADYQEGYQLGEFKGSCNIYREIVEQLEADLINKSCDDNEYISNLAEKFRVKYGMFVQSVM